MRARLARMGTRSQSANPVLEPLFRSVRANHPKADLALLERAYLTAEQMHGTQMRKSGDPYITHPLAVTTILADIGMTEPTLVAALLHDTVEDTPYTLEQVRQDFGDEVAQLVDGVTKLDKVKYGDSAQAETIRKMIVAMSRDIRVLVIKLADRLHNMRTLRYVRQETQERVARETLDIYAPLAHRLGMNTIKWELEDLAFATLHPKIYDEIVRMVAERAPSRDQFLAEVITQVEADLREAKVKATVTGRPKHYYSIYQKMIVGGREFSDIYDLVGIRVLVEDDRDCYTVLGVLHSRWNPVLGRFKDYVAMPKFNMYQSLHTTVIGPQGKPVELQIRTFAMHRRAEYGVAAHWKYKEDGRAGVDTDRARRPRRHDLGPPAAGLAERGRGPGRVPGVAALRDQPRRGLRLHPARRRDRAARPARRRSTSPTPCTPRSATTPSAPGSTAGWCRWSPALENGDVVEVFTSKAPTAGPSRDWLGFVKSPRARSKIRQWFTKERREEAIDQGKEQIAKLMRKEGLPLKRLMSHESLTLAAVHFKLADVSALYAAVGEGNLSAQAVVRRVIDLHGGDDGAAEDLAEGVTITGRRGRSKAQPGGDAGVIVKGAPDVWVKLAKCCTPVPPDPILGFVTKGGGVSVHRQTAPTPRACSPSPSGCSRSSGRRPASRASWSTSRSRRSTGPGCSPTSRWRSPTRTSTSSAPTCRPPATGSPRAGSPSRWPRPSTSTPCSRRSARCPASSTPTASPSSGRVGTSRDATFGALTAAAHRAGEVGAGPLGHLQEGLAGLEVLLELLDLLLVAGGPGLLEVGLDLGDRGLELGDHVVGAGGLLGVGARHCSSSTPRISCSTRRIRPSRSFIRSRGTLPAASHRSAMSRKARLAASRSVTGSSASASTSSASLTSALAANSSSCSAAAASRAPKNVSCAPRNRFHSASSTSRGAGPAAFHCAHQVAVAARGRAPVGRGGEALGLGGEPLLDAAGVVALLVLLGEVRLAAPGVRRARGREAAPQRVVGGPVDAGERLPLVEQLAHPVGAVAPVGALGERLGLGDDLLLALAGLGGALGALDLAGLALLLEHRRRARPAAPVRAARSPTALASATWSRTVRTDAAASSGDITPLAIRCSSSSTSKASAS